MISPQMDSLFASCSLDLNASFYSLAVEIMARSLVFKFVEFGAKIPLKKHISCTRHERSSYNLVKVVFKGAPTQKWIYILPG